MFKRSAHKILLKRLSEPRRFIQVLAGPRRTGKTTLARQIMSSINMESHYASADQPTLKDLTWIEQQWETARTKSRKERRKRKSLLILDEIQKITNWPETVKRLCGWCQVIRKFEIIGEATKQLPEELRNNYPDIPWKEMSGMRDRHIHFLFWSRL